MQPRPNENFGLRSSDCGLNTNSRIGEIWNAD